MCLSTSLYLIIDPLPFFYFLISFMTALEKSPPLNLICENPDSGVTSYIILIKSPKVKPFYFS
jgi:hypothetical protein